MSHLVFAGLWLLLTAGAGIALGVLVWCLAAERRERNPFGPPRAPLAPGGREQERRMVRRFIVSRLKR